MKRFFDFLGSLFLLIILIIPMIFISIAVRVTMGSPVLFKQKRPGLHEKPFSIKKFRTMTNEKDEFGSLLPNRQRMTKTGSVIRKLSLDELPQLINVLKGDMSFVGPRPLLMEYLHLYNNEQAKRHCVRPGITGLAQVKGRNAITWEEKFRYDVKYVNNQSFFLDIKIVFLTFAKVLKSEGVNKGEDITMEKFKGSNNNDRK